MHLNGHAPVVCHSGLYAEFSSLDPLRNRLKIDQCARGVAQAVSQLLWADKRDELSHI